jgi:hypothetical protein
MSLIVDWVEALTELSTWPITASGCGNPLALKCDHAPSDRQRDRACDERDRKKLQPIETLAALINAS